MDVFPALASAGADVLATGISFSGFAAALPSLEEGVGAAFFDGADLEFGLSALAVTAEVEPFTAFLSKGVAAGLEYVTLSVVFYRIWTLLL